MKKVILITDVRFWEQGSGHRARIDALLKYLAKRVSLTIVCTGPENIMDENKLERIYQAFVIIIEKKIVLSSNEYVRKLKKLLIGREFDAVIIEYIHNSHFLKLFNDDVRTILDCHDIISERTSEFRKFKFQGFSYELTEEIEYKIFDIYDNIVVLCKPDYNKLKKVIHESKILICPHPPVLKDWRIRKYAKIITFLGSNYLPNVDGINYFIEKCWPALSYKYDLTLRIYGSVSSSVKTNGINKISILGMVENLSEIYSETDVVINPVRFGAGIKIKNLEALANGMPLVTTSHGARGLEELGGIGFLIADHPDEFISAIELFITNPEIRHSFGKNGKNHIKNKFSPEICFAQLLSTL